MEHGRVVFHLASPLSISTTNGSWLHNVFMAVSGKGDSFTESIIYVKIYYLVLVCGCGEAYC